MSTLAVLTPSFASDFELCRDLNRSVLESMPTDAHHHIVVSPRDRQQFAALRGPRTEVWTVDQFIPRRMLPIPLLKHHGSHLWLNVRRPFPPIRGWVMQQIIKLRAATELGADLVLLVDSDVVLVRPVSSETFLDHGKVRFYRSPDAIGEDLPRHVVWHRVARRLLGLPPVAAPPLTDYISPFVVWERSILTALHKRIEHVNGRPWMDVVGSQPHLSECILYGVFVDEVLGSAGHVSVTDSALVHECWQPLLTVSAAKEFLRGVGPDDVAVTIHARKGTPLDVRRAALADCLRGIPGTT